MMKLLTWGIYLVIFCLPLYLVRFKIFGIPTTVLEIMIYILFIIWLFKKGFKGIKRDLKGFKGVILPIVLIFVGVTLATIFSSDPPAIGFASGEWRAGLRTSAGIWKGWFIDPLLFFVVVIAAVKNFKQIKGIFYSLIFSGAVVSIISLIYLIQGKLAPYLTVVRFAGLDPTGRLQGFYNSPNYLAMYLAPILIINIFFIVAQIICTKIRVNAPARRCAAPRPRSDHALGLWSNFLTNNLRLDLLLIVNCLLLIVILFFTKSFGTWLGIVVAFCFGLAVYLYKMGNKKLVLGVLVLGLIIVFILSYLKFISEQGKLSFNARLVIWQKAWQVFKANPVLGIGPGTFGDYFPPYPEWGVPQPHNLYLAFLLQTGILGFIGFIWLLVWFFRTGIKLLPTFYFLLPILLMSVMVYILIHGLVDTQYWKNDLSMIFWLIVGLMVVLSRRSPSAKSGSRILDYVGASGEK